jgi:6-phosphogluconolactonase
MTVATFEGEDEWIDAALGEFRDVAGAALSSGGSSLALCLAGGRTPESVYRAMAALPLEGLAVDLWLGDERVVREGDPARNGLMVARAFSRCAWRPAPRLRAWPIAKAGGPAPSAAMEYADALAAALGPEPAFDLAFLGLGADGHTASLFPGSPALEERGSLAATSRAPVAPCDRVTLTLAALSAARRRVFLVRGRDKIDAIQRLEREDPSMPASALAGPGAIALYLR